jgi:hypothetical protein
MRHDSEKMGEHQLQRAQMVALGMRSNVMAAEGSHAQSALIKQRQ